MSTLGSEDRTAGLTGIAGALKASPAPPPAIPTLTILYHPRLERVGERAVLRELALGKPAWVARRKPEFSAPGEYASRPLDDRYLSRKPLRLEADGGVVRLDPTASRTRVAVDGAELLGPRELAGDDLERGVVLELAGRVVLLLHLYAKPREPVRERFGMIGDSAGIARVRADVRRLAEFDVPVLLRGATGAGKELVARAIHDASRRSGRGFLAVNLGAVAPSLAAAELFGAVKGAFTGAVRSQDGYFRRADGGTLLLDEVGEAPAEVQVMLLRVLETGEIFPAGAQSPRRVDVRVIAATDADLEAAAEAGDFRQPLLHRLAGYEIWIPPLAERRDDVGWLLVHFLRRELAAIGREDLLEPGDAPWLGPEIVARLARYDWPGNVRQLRNVAQQLVINSHGRDRAELPAHLGRLLTGEAPPIASVGSAKGAAAPKRQRRRKPSEVSDDELVSALANNRWELQATADALGISRPSLYVLIEASPNVRTASDLTPEEIADCHRLTGGELEAMVDTLRVSARALKRRVKELGLS